MKKYLLDTGILIGLLNGRNDCTRYFDELLDTQIHFSVINQAEILSGVKVRNNQKQLDVLTHLFGLYTVIPIDSAISQITSDLYVSLRKNGKIGEKITPDLYIASTCIYHDLILVTYNKKDFVHVPTLILEGLIW